ncbi:uncharacterized protein LOC6503162 isoform X1 [Drosophila ananassae]|nr:uncharacterized protein LOC6503162 isoform X1 [Drosophila ananassae]XP_032308958.1 uncharacterized protein LOC6503162 isoform X1 [Drosophila ananassae]XP_044572846.1 uncharacterized protein LOC6503162 isoform X1 [Drosophila ananassae]
MEFTDIRLRSLLHYDPEAKSFSPSSTIKYFRMPEDHEYPLDLAKNYKNYVHRNNEYPGDFDMVQYYFEHVNKLEFIRQDYDVFCCRRLLIILINIPYLNFDKRESIEAFRVKGCIFLRLQTDHINVEAERSSYTFKARQLLFSDAPGQGIDMDAPIDERAQTYGMFSARLGQFRLLYSCEVPGVANTKKLGDLTDPKELEKCSLATIRVLKKPLSWRHTFRHYSWLLQNYFCGGSQLAVASFDQNGIVSKKIEVVSADDLIESKRSDLQSGFKKMNDFLEQIKQKLDKIDNPNVSLKFTFDKNKLVFDEAFKTDFVDYANQF